MCMYVYVRFISPFVTGQDSDYESRSACWHWPWTSCSLPARISRNDGKACFFCRWGGLFGGLTQSLFRLLWQIIWVCKTYGMGLDFEVQDDYPEDREVPKCFFGFAFHTIFHDHRIKYRFVIWSLIFPTVHNTICGYRWTKFSQLLTLSNTSWLGAWGPFASGWTGPFLQGTVWGGLGMAARFNHFHFLGNTWHSKNWYTLENYWNKQQISPGTPTIAATSEKILKNHPLEYLNGSKRWLAVMLPSPLSLRPDLIGDTCPVKAKHIGTCWTCYWTIAFKQ